MARMALALLFALACQQARGESAASLIVSGGTSPAEQCLTAQGSGRVTLTPCAAAVSEGQGREIWSLASGGKLKSLADGRCAVAHQGELELADCATSAVWELQPNGQLKTGGMCLSIHGAGPGQENVVEHAALSASSTYDAQAHGAARVLGGSGFWASRLDPQEDVVFTVDLGSRMQLEELHITWEFPASSFAVRLSDGSGGASQAFATSANALSQQSIALGGQSASKLELILRAPHTTKALLEGHALFGIRRLELLGGSTSLTVTDCEEAASSHDARSAFFLVTAPEFDPAPAKELEDVLPALAAAEASLAATTADLYAAMPHVAACLGEGAASFATRAPAPAHEPAKMTELSVAKALLQEARASILAVRGALSA